MLRVVSLSTSGLTCLVDGLVILHVLFAVD